MGGAAPKSLLGVTVLVTRPAGQARFFCDEVTEAGGTAICFPSIEIQALPLSASELDRIYPLDQFDFGLFISSNAVCYGVPLIEAESLVPGALRVIAVGQSTARALAGLNLPVDIVPTSGFNSEALLAEPELQDLSGQRVLIFKGKGGRALLEKTLLARGAIVKSIDLYRRARPEFDPDVAVGFLGLRSKKVIALTSGDAVRNLDAMMGKLGNRSLKNNQLIVGSHRIAGLVKQMGFIKNPIVASDPGDESMLATLKHWAS